MKNWKTIIFIYKINQQFSTYSIWSNKLWNRVLLNSIEIEWDIWNIIKCKIAIQETMSAKGSVELVVLIIISKRSAYTLNEVFYSLHILNETWKGLRTTEPHTIDVSYEYIAICVSTINECNTKRWLICKIPQFEIRSMVIHIFYLCLNE